jgi:hypothetical protein
MGVFFMADGLARSAEPVEESAGRLWATGTGVPSLPAGWLALCGAAIAGERR